MSYEITYQKDHELGEVFFMNFTYGSADKQEQVNVLAVKKNIIPEDDSDPSVLVKQSKLHDILNSEPSELLLDVFKDNVLHVLAETDGYHRINLVMAQVPDCVKLLDFNTQEQGVRVHQSMSAIGFNYCPEDRETCFISTKEEITTEVVERFAKFLDPRLYLFYETDHPGLLDDFDWGNH